MKQVSSELIAYLNAVIDRPAQLIVADCYTFTLLDGTQIFYTTADLSVSLNGNLFLANSVRIDGLKYKIAVGLDVDEQDITIAATSADLVGTPTSLANGTPGIPFLQALRAGVFDGAYITRDRAFLASWPALPPAVAVGSVTLFHGRVSTIDKIGRTSAQMKVKSDLVLLDIDMPRNVWSPACLHTLYDTGCQAAKVPYTGAAAAGSTNLVISWTGADAKFGQGVILFTSGANNGVSAVVKTVVEAASLTLSYPLDFTPAEGDGFTVYPGCDKTYATCASRFANTAHFRGFPYVPPPESAY